MKHRYYLLACLALLLAAAVIAFAGDGPGRASEPSAREIRVSGEGTISTKPDLAHVTLGVETQAALAREVQRRNDEIAGRILKSLRNLGIAEDDIATVDYRLYPEYRYDNGKKRDILAGYRCVHTLHVTVRELDRTGAVLDALVDAGGNVVQDVGFTLADGAGARDRALEKAVADASRKAEAISRAAGVKLGGIIRVTCLSGSPNPPVITVRKEMALDAASAQVAPGSIEVRAEVEMVFGF